MNIKITYGEHTENAKKRCYEYILSRMKDKIKTEKEQQTHRK